MQLAITQQATGTSPPQTVTESPVPAEIRKHLETSDTGNTLDFWQRHADEFAVLSAMAYVYLASSPRSIPVECLFSNIGLTLNKKKLA